MQEIKNCPICGGKAHLHNLGDNYASPYVVECSTDISHHYGAHHTTEKQAIDAWNRWVEYYIFSSKPTQATIRREILDEAARCVCGDRESEYGSPEDNFKLIAALWGDYLRWEITPVDVAMMMTMLKIARIKGGTMTRDSFVDAAGYMACGGEIAARMEGNAE